MSIAVNCPTCGKAYNLNESLAGKKVRCKHCADTFPVTFDEVLPVNPAAGAPDGATQIKGEPGSKPPVVLEAVAADDLPEVVKVAGGAAKKNGFPIFLVVAGGLAVALLLLCAGLGTGVFFIVRHVKRAADDFADTIHQNGPGVQQTSRPRTLADAVADVKSGDASRQKQGAEWLAKEPVNPAKRAEVARSLEARLNDFDPGVKSAAANALVTWGGPENVPALVKCVEIEDRDTIEPAIKALVKIGDPRAVAPFAKLLPTGRRGQAVNALQSLGPRCESEVVKFAFHPDQGTRDEAQRLLRGWKTKDEILIVQALADLKTVDPGRRSTAAQWLSKSVVVAKYRDEVSVALNPVLKEANEAAHNNAIHAVAVWATKANVPTLIDLLTDPAWRHPFARQLRGILFSTLANLKDQRAAVVFCKDLASRDWNGKAQVALEVLGPAAETEVVKYLHHPDEGTRKRAAALLAKFGTKSDILLAQTILDLESAESGRRSDAAAWLATTTLVEKRRDAVSAALNPLLTEKNEGVRNNALKAVRVWATKANVPTLIEMLGDSYYNGPFRGDLRGILVATLADLKDARAAAAFCKDLTHRERSAAAVAALEGIGAAAEPAVLKYLHHPDAGVQVMAANLLKKYGTKEEALFKQALVDLKGPEAGRKQGAATTLAKLPVNEKERPNVSAALDPLLRERNAGVALAAMKALKVWATKDNVPTLVKIVADHFIIHRPPEQTWIAMEVLIALKDERAYWPIARYAGHPFDNAKGRLYLEKLGAVAEPEVTKHLTDKDNQTRQQAWKALGIIGSKTNLAKYQAAANAERESFTKICAQRALQAIAERK